MLSCRRVVESLDGSHLSILLYTSQGTGVRNAAAGVS